MHRNQAITQAVSLVAIAREVAIANKFAAIGHFRMAQGALDVAEFEARRLEVAND
jgi:hypothetical protein